MIPLGLFFIVILNDNQIVCFVMVLSIRRHARALSIAQNLGIPSEFDEYANIRERVRFKAMQATTTAATASAFNSVRPSNQI